MAADHRFILIPFLLSCVFPALDNRHVDHVIRQTGNTDLDNILSKFRINLPDGIDPKNINVTSITIKTCTGLKEQLSLLNIQLQQTTVRNSQLDNESFGLRREVRALKLQLSTCSSTASAITGSYQTQLLNQLKQLLETSENDTFLILKTIALTREMDTVNEKVQHAANATETADIRVVRVDLEGEKKRLENLQKHLEEAENAQAKLILKIISMLKEVRELETTSTNQATTLQTLLQAKEREFAKAQAEIKELQRKLQLKIEVCSGLEDRYEQVKTEFEQKISELNTAGNHKAALVLNVINLQYELKTLRDLIATSTDPQRVSELQGQLENKQDELNSKTADIERLIANPKIILMIIELQSEIWDLQKVPNETTAGRVDEFQDRVDGLLSVIDDKGDDNTKLMLTIMRLKSRVEQLQRQLSDLQTSQTSQKIQLTKDLTSKQDELQKYINELTEKDETNAKLILKITDLHNQLRNLEKERHNERQNPSVVTELRDKLKAKEKKIRALQNESNQTDCSTYVLQLTDLHNKLDGKMKELQSKAESVTSLALQVSTLTVQLEELKRQLQNTESESKRKELQQIIEEKNTELTEKTEELLKVTSAEPQRLLHIIAIQTEIEKLVYVAANDTDYNKIRELQDRLNDLVDGIKDGDNEYTKLMFKILTQQNEIARLENQEKSQREAASERIGYLENQLEDIRNQIAEKTLLLGSSDKRTANLTAHILELHKNIKPLEDKISELKVSSSENTRELQKRLDLMRKQLQDSELRLQEADTRNFELVMEITDLRTQLKKAQKKAVAERNAMELEQQLQTQQRENRKLENANKDLKQEVQELKTSCTDDVISQCDDLQRQLQQSQEDTDRLQWQLHETDANHKALQQELEEMRGEKNNLQGAYHNLQDEKNNLEDIVQDLQNKLSDVDDKTIYGTKSTLDPNTANPRILLSADNSEMSTTEQIQNVPDHPGRFNIALAVLGMAGFSSGRHYWEVSVAGKLCYHLGMASESAQRRGTIIFSPTKGFWTVVLNKQGQFKAVERRHAIIPLETQPLRLGILLDYKKGQISFYDAGTRSHLYSFVQQSFTDKIYPFINFCVEDVEGQTPIVINSPGSVDWIK
ncbi:hypothetical protein NQZ68_028090 [Dissostichus eleginoides]|nr:hypothetical protein NQZ68_028090 [Dissostichus eleginoides]